MACRLQARQSSQRSGYDLFRGINEGSQAAAYTSTPQFDPTVAEVPHFWEAVKGKPAAPADELYDIPAKASMDSRTTAKSIEFIKAHAKGSNPFYTYVAFTHFHPPWGVHPDFKNKSKAGIYADTKMEVDHNF